MSVDLFALSLLVIFAVAAAAYDWTLRRIPNWLCLAVLACGLVLAGYRGSWVEVGSHALHAFVALVVGMLLFRLKAFGGGDAKFYTGVAGWFGIGTGLALLVNTSLSGLVLFVCWVSIRRLMGKPFRIRDPGAFDKFPYGVAIGAGGVLTYWWQWFNLGGGL